MYICEEYNIDLDVKDLNSSNMDFFLFLMGKNVIQ